MEKGLVSVIIVSCDRRDYLEKCLVAVKSQSYNPVEVILVNNCSTGEVENWMKDKFPDITVIPQKENLLFCRAHNMGIAKSKGEYVLCLNDDIILEESFIEEAVNAMNRDGHIGIVSGKIMRPDKKTIDTTGLFLARSRVPLERGFNQIDNGQYDREGFVFGAGGAAGFYRREMLEDINLGRAEYFDNDYGIFYEDLDLCWRANRFGWKGYYAPKAIAYHKRGGTVKENIPRIWFLKKYNFAYLPKNLQARLIKNRYMTMIKNDSLQGILSNFCYILWYDIKLWGYILIFRPQLIWHVISSWHIDISWHSIGRVR